MCSAHGSAVLIRWRSLILPLVAAVPMKASEMKTGPSFVYPLIASVNLLRGDAEAPGFVSPFQGDQL
jgi:hypothetical protein